METLRRAQESRAERRVRFRVASARSGRILREVFREDEEGAEDSADSDTAAGSEADRAVSPAVSEANGHLIGLEVQQQQGDSGSEPDDLLVYASATQEQLFSRKRVNIFSKNGTIRGVRDKVSAGQVLFNNLSKLYVVSTVHKGRGLRLQTQNPRAFTHVAHLNMLHMLNHKELIILIIISHDSTVRNILACLIIVNENAMNEGKR